MATQGPNGDFPYLPSGAAEVNRLIEENGELFADTQCKVCNAVLISQSQKLAHYQSKKHEAKVRRYMATHEDEPFAKKFKPSSHDAESGEVLQGGDVLPSEGDKYKSCQVCNMSFSSAVVAQSHYQGKVHAKNLRLKSFGVQALAVTQPVVPSKKLEEQISDGPAVQDPNRFCNICQASFNNPVMAQQHYSGKKHKKHLTKQKLMKTFGPSAVPASTVKGYPCTMCNIELNSVEQYQAHISGAKHKNHVRLKEGGNSTVTPLPKTQPDYVYGYNQQQQQVQEDWGSLKQDYESGGL